MASETARERNVPALFFLFFPKNPKNLLLILSGDMLRSHRGDENAHQGSRETDRADGKDHPLLRELRPGDPRHGDEIRPALAGLQAGAHPAALRRGHPAPRLLPGGGDRPAALQPGEDPGDGRGRVPAGGGRQGRGGKALRPARPGGPAGVARHTDPSPTAGRNHCGLFPAPGGPQLPDPRDGPVSAGAPLTLRLLGGQAGRSGLHPLAPEYGAGDLLLREGPGASGGAGRGRRPESILF